MIIPRANRTLLEHIWILDETTAPDASSFTFKHAYFMDNMTTDVERQSDLLSDVPKFLHLLRHPVRSLNFIPRAQPKSVHRNGRVKTVRAHFASSCLGREVTFLLNVTFYLSFFYLVKSHQRIYMYLFLFEFDNIASFLPAPVPRALGGWAAGSFGALPPGLRRRHPPLRALPPPHRLRPRPPPIQGAVGGEGAGGDGLTGVHQQLL